MATRKPIPVEQAETTGRLIVARAREQRDEAEALIAESRQARLHTHALLEASNAILDAAVTIINDVLARRRLALAEPVAATFHTDEHGSSGIEITVRLQNAARAAEAQQAIIERFGGEAQSDRIIVT